MWIKKRQPATRFYQTWNTGDQQMKAASEGSKSHSSILHFQSGVKPLGRSLVQPQLCFQLYRNPVSSSTVCPHCSTLCGLQFLFGCDQLRTWLPRDLEGRNKQKYFFNFIEFNIKETKKNEHPQRTSVYLKSNGAILPIIPLKMSGGSWGLGQSSPVNVVLRPCRECVANVSLSKSIISSADVYFL